MEILLTVALPVFALIWLGYGAGHWRLLSPEGIAGLNAFVYRFALPVLLFDKLSATPIGRVLEGPFALAWLLGDLLIYGLVFAAAMRALGRSRAEAAQLAMGAVYGNTGYMGLPIAQAAAGRAATIPMALCTALDTLVLLPLTLLLGGGQERPGGWRRALGPALAPLFTDPLLLAILLGIAVSAVGVPMPGPVRAFTGLLGAAAGPCALFVIGAALSGRAQAAPAHGFGLEEALAPVGLVAGAKLVLHPLAVWALMSGVFRVDPLWGATAILAAALPTGSTVGLVAARFRTAEQPISAAILVSTAASVVTLTLALFLLFGG